MNKLLAGAILTLSFMANAVRSQTVAPTSDKDQLFIVLNKSFGEAAQYGAGAEYRFGNASGDGQTIRFRNAFAGAGFCHDDADRNYFYLSAGSDLVSIGRGPANDRVVGIGPEASMRGGGVPVFATWGPYLRIGKRSDFVNGKIALQAGFGPKAGFSEALVFSLKVNIANFGHARKKRAAPGL